MSTALALVLLAAGGLPTLGVAQVDARIEVLNGQIVRVQGWLGTCAGYDCTIHPTAQDERHFREAVLHRGDGPRPALPPHLSIGGGSAAFDRWALPLNHHYVVVTARVSNRCRLPHGICTDRAPDLDPISIAPWAGPKP